MANLERLRDRLPLIVFVLFAIVVLMLLGFACACLTDDPMQAIERALSFVPELPGPADVWGTSLAALSASLLLASRASPANGRASPALLQRFRF